MKRIIALVAVLALFTMCHETSVITGSWINTKKYNNIVVTALTMQTVPKSTIEKAFSRELSQAGLIVCKGIDMFLPNVTNNDTDSTIIMSSVHRENADALLTISFVNSETNTRYEGNHPYNPWDLPYYRTFWGYYSYWYHYGYNPLYYTPGRIYYIEINLFDATTEDLVWSAQSEPYDPVDIEPFTKQFARQIVSKLIEDGIIEPTTPPNGDL